MLVPRPETETVVEGALDFVVRGGLRMEKLRVLDIGTGSGALLLALLHELSNAVGTGTDVSTAALQVARENAEYWGFKARSNFVICDIASGVEGAFDLVVTNPPYIAHDEIASLAPEVRDYDPKVALDGGEDGLAAYRAIAGEAKRLLAPGGRLFVELGSGQEDGCSGAVYQCRIDRRHCPQGFGRNPARAWRGPRVMSMLHSHLMKSAGLFC